MQRQWIALAALVALNAALLVAGAGRGARGEASGRLRVGLVLDVGGLGDRSFNDAAHRGLTRAEAQLDLETRLIEPGDGSDRESAIRQLAAAGFDLVIGVGFIFSDDLRAAARQFPEVKFACVDYSPGQPPPANLAGLRFREHEGSFLVGAIAGLVTRTQRVGFVGGMRIPLIRKFEAGYEAGVRQVCPRCQVLSAYAGTDPRAFADPTTGKELALAQYGQGADVIFHASGNTGKGVFNAARELGKLAIGVDSDQFDEAPCCVLTSMVKGVDVVVEQAILDLAAGRFAGGEREFGLAENGVGFVLDDRNRDRIGEAALLRVEELRRQIVSGAIEVPWQ
ncbi:MAG: BMP family ABC transporter substrate-binding protein [Deltaproteobacteria bacterium]|nr:BMP family ABC transporter substrate-binding protein [Deltaproteobacteria bacterium]